MRILYFHQHFCTPSGAGGTRSYEMARTLIERGHEVTIVCGSYTNHNTGLTGPARHWIRQGEVDGIRVIEILLTYSNYDSLAKRSMIFMLFALRSIYLAWRLDYDLLFATSTPLTAGIPGIAMRVFKPRKPFVFEVRDLWPELPREMGVITNRPMLWSMSVLEWVSYNSAKACIGLSPGIVKGIRKRCSDKKPVAMIPNGCDLELFSNAKPQCNTGFQPVVNATPHCNTGFQPVVKDNQDQNRQDACVTRPSKNQEPGTKNRQDACVTNRFRAVFTGAHGMANGLDAVLDAAAVLKERGRDDIEIVLIGDGKLKPGLIERATNEALTNCHFRDPMPKTALAETIHEYNAGLMILANVSAFYYGTSPNKFFDYIASGLPVINNYPGWLADMIAEYECGIAVPPANPEAFADALVELADDPQRCARMGSNARQLAEERFGRRHLGVTFADFLEKACRRRAKG